MHKYLLFFIAFFIYLNNLYAQPPAGNLLFPASINAMKPYGSGLADSVIQTIPVTGQPFTNALLINTYHSPVAGQKEGGLTSLLETSLHKGDVLWVSFKARSLQSKRETGESFVELRFDNLVNGKYTWPPHLERGISIGSEWAETSIPFVMEQDVKPGDARLIIQFDTYPQRFELGPVTCMNYGPGVKLADLPRSVIRYGGDEPAAPWRKAAAERIEQYRKGDLAITVMDAKGKPLPGADVQVHMVRNAFTFGTATSSQRLLDSTSTDSQKYRDTLLKYFNQVVLENEIKSKNWDKFNYSQTSKGIVWLKSHHIPIRGHVMVWPSWQHAGTSFAHFRNDTTGLRAAILKRIDEQTTTLKGFFTEWDVINEPFAHDDFLKLLGRHAMVDWFNAARKNTPGVKLFLNDYTMFHGEGPGSASEAFFKNVQYLQENGAPIDAIGEQGHIGGTPPPIPTVLERLNYFAKLGLPIQISEFDINSNDDDFKARYLRDFLTVVYSHPAAIGFVQWGFWEGQHWFPVAALWDKNWNLRANGKAFTELVSHTWHTDADGQTGTNGMYTVRGFTGDYEIVVTKGSKVIKQQTTLTTKGRMLTIKWPD